MRVGWIGRAQMEGQEEEDEDELNDRSKCSDDS